MKIFPIRVITIMLFMLFASASVYAKSQCPSDLDWLRKQCGDAALSYAHNGKVYLTELSTGKTEVVGKGGQPEFSPDSSKLSWIDGSTVKGRMRKGDTAVHTIATKVERKGGVHWISNSEVVVLRKGKRREWYRISLSGKKRKLPELNRLGAARGETDVRLGKDGVWSYVSGTTWKTSSGGSGHIGGNCSGSLSPDGRAVTGLKGDHRRCAITSIRKGGVKGQLKWLYDGTFDNHRWSSNDPRFVVCEDEKYKRMVVMKIGSTYCTRMGKKGENPKSEMYGDFTVGDGEGDGWSEQDVPSVSATDRDHVPELEPVVLANSWPGNSDGLAFVWENNLKPNEVFDIVDQTPKYCTGMLRGLAKFDRYHGMALIGGAFHVEGKDRELLAMCKKSNRLTIEAVITTDNLRQGGPARIISFSSGTGSRNFTLGQEEDRLILRLRTPRTGENGTNPQVKLCTIRTGHPYHIVVTYRLGLLVCYLNGERVLSTKSIRGDFSNWSSQHLLFGDEWGSGRDWSGHLEGIAIYSRFMTSREAEHNYALYAKRLNDRVPVERTVVQARLLETTGTPPVESLQEYPRALVVHTYEVKKILKGEVGSKKILVAHWAFLDRKLVPSIGKKRVGTVYKLELERFDDNPQLESEMQFNDIEDFDLPFYYDVGGV